MSPSLDFKQSVKLTSDPAQYDPVTLITKLRKNQLNHLKYDMTLYDKTKTMLNDLLKQSQHLKSDKQKNAINALHNIEEFEEKPICKARMDKPFKRKRKEKYSS